MSKVNAITNIKMVAVGHGCMGKTCLVIRYYIGKFPVLNERPLVYDGEGKMVKVGEETVRCWCTDTGGGEDYATLRPLSYDGVDVFLLLAAIDHEENFHDAKNYWWPELSHHCPGVPVILVGSKVDLRDENSVSFEEGQRMAKKIGAVKYIECSALKNTGVKEVFEEAAKLGLKFKRKERCNIL